MKNNSRYLHAATQFCILSVFVLFIDGPARAQDIHLYYDLFTDSLSYRKGDQVLHNPKIRKGDVVAIHFTEYNPYLYEAELAVEQQNNEPVLGSNSIGAFQSLIPGLSRFLPIFGIEQDSSAAPTGLLSFLNMPLFRIGEKSLGLKDLFSQSRGTEQVLEQARVQLAELSLIQAEMGEIYREIQQLEKSNQAGRFAMQGLDLLLYNPQMKPSMIKKLVLEYQAMVFPNKTADSLQLEDAFQWQERPAAKQRMLQELAVKQRAVDEKMAALAPLADNLSDLGLNNPALDQFTGDLRQVTEHSRSLKQQIDAYVEYQAKKKGQDLSLEQIMDLQLKFREIAAQNFRYDCVIQAEKDIILVNATFLLRDSLGNGALQTAGTPAVKTIKLETRGGLHLSTGVGVGFARLLDPVQSFNVQDDRIVVDKGDMIQPSLTTLIHFYANNPGRIKLAGSFGLGIPLSGGNISSINFYLGPSLLLGREQRIVLSGGLMTGPVKRLSRGLQPGDPFDLNSGDIPLQTRYELGYFLGISVNMGR